MKREPWHSDFLQSLGKMADAELQRRAWIEGECLSVPSPTELVCQVFDDSAIDELLDAGELFSPAADALLREMSSLIGRVNLEQGAAQLLKDDRWLRLTEIARNALEAISETIEG